MKHLLPALLVMLALAGCREPLTSPLDMVVVDDTDVVGVMPVEPTGPQLRALYVKVPIQLREGQTGDARTEPIPDAAGYRWTFSGAGEVYTEPNDPERLGRILSVVGGRDGRVRVTVRAYDTSGASIAVGTASFEVIDR